MQKIVENEPKHTITQAPSSRQLTHEHYLHEYALNTRYTPFISPLDHSTPIATKSTKPAKIAKSAQISRTTPPSSQSSRREIFTNTTLLHQAKQQHSYTCKPKQSHGWKIHFIHHNHIIMAHETKCVRSNFKHLLTRFVARVTAVRPASRRLRTRCASSRLFAVWSTELPWDCRRMSSVRSCAFRSSALSFKEIMRCTDSEKSA